MEPGVGVKLVAVVGVVAAAMVGTVASAVAAAAAAAAAGNVASASGADQTCLSDCGVGRGARGAAAAYAPPIQIAESPRMYVIDNVFTEEQANELIAFALPNLIPSITMNQNGKAHGTERTRKMRTSEAASVESQSPNDVVSTFRNLMSAVALMPEENGEALQVTRYRKDERYEVHFDSSLATARYVTVVAFLRAPETGGELAFPWAKRGRFVNVTLPGVDGPGRPLKELEGLHEEPPAAPLCLPGSNSLRLKPVVGRMVVWFNHDPQLRRYGYEAMHAGCPVLTADEKWIAQLWLKWHQPSAQNSIAEIMRAVKLDWLLPQRYND